MQRLMNVLLGHTTVIQMLHVLTQLVVLHVLAMLGMKEMGLLAQVNLAKLHTFKHTHTHTHMQTHVNTHAHTDTHTHTYSICQFILKVTILHKKYFYVGKSFLTNFDFL